MKIKNISCTQFAGIRDVSVSFADGINIICGKNESGKSTVVNLISRTLFQDARLDKRSDKEFFDLYFPSARRNSPAVGDFADGRITLETECGSFTLSKEWGSDSRCSLSTPDGVIRDRDSIEMILKDVLVYGEGVYSDMLLSSQSNTDTSLRALLDASKRTEAKGELLSAVSKAFSESDGISIDAIEQAISEKIDEIAGKHWDTERMIPQRKAGRWSSGLGEILKAYYALEDARAVLEELSRLQGECVRASGEYAVRDGEVNVARKEYEKFSSFASRIALKGERKKAIDRLVAELSRINDVLTLWPGLVAMLDKAKKLKGERDARYILDKYKEAARISKELITLKEAVIDRVCPSDSEIADVRNAIGRIASIEAKMCGMNINAAVKLLEAEKMHIVSLRTGEEIDISSGNAVIGEAVRIIVPNLFEMQLSPASIDVELLEEQLSAEKAIVSEILSKYNVGSLDELEMLSKEISGINSKIQNAEVRLEYALSGESMEQLEALAMGITEDVREKDQIESEISLLCASTDIDKFITAKETTEESFTAEYKSVTDLKARAFDLSLELEKARKAVSDDEDIPEEYLGISDAESYLSSLQSALKLKESIREAALTAKTSALSRLEAFTDSGSDDCEENLSKAEEYFTEQKKLLLHWLHISEVFYEMKEQLRQNPMQDIADRFSYYLGIISSDRVLTEFPEGDKLNFNIYSNDRLLDYGKLSEGTKETVSLAFRLAVLDHLFPNGGGVAVFDDPFTDMDSERTEKSCKLIQECAKRHQVIFLTCKEDYADMLEGNIIRF